MFATKTLLAVLATTLIATAALFSVVPNALATTSIDLEVRAAELATICSSTQAQVDRLAKCQRAKHHTIVLRKMVVREDRGVMRVTKAVRKLNRAVLTSSDVKESTYDALLALNARVLRLDGSALRLSEQALPDYPTRLSTKIEKATKRVRALDKAVRSLDSDTWSVVPILPDITPDDPQIPAPEPTPPDEPAPSIDPTPIPPDAIVFPEGTFTGTFSFPDGATIIGAGMDRTHLKGTVFYGSGQTFRDLKLGDASCTTRPGKVASGTRFERCRFIGGGQTGVSWPNAMVLLIGSQYSCDHITFKDCIVERNMGSDPDFSKGFNNISLTERAGVHVESILFEDCTVEGSPRMGLECYVNATNITQGYRDITLRGCTFEASDIHTIDFADAPEGRASGILVEDCTIQGGGVTKVKWGYGLCLEMPLNVVIRNNHFTRAWMSMLNMADPGGGRSGPGALITGNTFDMSTGLDPTTDEPIILIGDRNIFTGNQLTGYYPLPSRIVGLWNADYNTVNNNTFVSTGGKTPVYVHSGIGNVITPNTVR